MAADSQSPLTASMLEGQNMIPYKVKIWKDDGGWLAEIPQLSCVTQGETLEEVSKMVQYLYEDVKHFMIVDGLPLPPSDLEGWGMYFTVDFGD